jgi:hypothetical protein
VNGATAVRERGKKSSWWRSGTEGIRRTQPFHLRLSSIFALSAALAFLVAGATKSWAYNYEVTPIYCDGIDDYLRVPFLCTLLPDNGAKDSKEKGKLLTGPVSTVSPSESRLGADQVRRPAIASVRSFRPKCPSRRLSQVSSESPEPH